MSGHPALLFGIPSIPSSDPGGNRAAAQGEAVRNLRPIGEEEPGKNHWLGVLLIWEVQKQESEPFPPISQMVV